MSRTATTEACPASWRQRQPYWLETDDGQCVPLTISDPRADASNALVFKLDTKLKAKGHALKMELKIPIPTVFSARRSISTEQAAKACPLQEILAPTFMAPVHDHTASGLPRREAFGLVIRYTSTFYLYVLTDDLGRSCHHAELISRTSICISTQPHRL